MPTSAVNQAVHSQEVNVVLDDRPTLINSSEKDLTWKEPTALAQLRFEHCRLLGSYKSRINKDSDLNVCCRTPHDVKHLFNCTAHSATLTDFGSRPMDGIHELDYLEAGGTD